MDSGVISMLWDLGWFGSFFYGFGLYLILKDALKGKDTFAVAAAALALSLLSLMLIANQLNQVPGVILWSMLSLAAASHYHEKAQSDKNVDAYQPRVPT